MNQPIRSFRAIHKPMMNTSATNPSMQTSSAPNEQQMLAQALRGNRGMPQQPQQFSEEEKMIIMQIMQQQNLSEEQAIQQYMSMKSVA